MVLKVAVVTGANKGIGYGIVRALCKRGVPVVYLTARDIKRGAQAIEHLKKEGLKPNFHQLDVTDANSVKSFADYLQSEHHGINILINNAGVTMENIFKTTYEESKRIIDINYRSYFNVQHYLFPLLNNNARVINVSSGFGHIKMIGNEYWIKCLTSDNLEVKDIDNFVDWFLESIKNNTLKEEDIKSKTSIPYIISKVAVCALTRVMQKNIDRGISINSLHPGFVKTDLTKNFGTITIEEASEAPVYLALDCDQSVKGKFFWFDKSDIDWTDTSFQIYDDESYEEILNLMKSYEKADN